MPRTPNKIIINSTNFAADANTMTAAFESSARLDQEIIELGGGLKNNALLKEDADLHLAEQEAICEELDKMMADCIQRQRALVDKRRRWFDAKL